MKQSFALMLLFFLSGCEIRPLWKAKFEKNIAPSLCAKDTLFTSCFQLSPEQCRAEIEKQRPGCMKEPPLVVTVFRGLQLGREIGECIGEKVERENRARFHYAGACPEQLRKVLPQMVKNPDEAFGRFLDRIPHARPVIAKKPDLRDQYFDVFVLTASGYREEASRKLAGFTEPLLAQYGPGAGDTEVLGYAGLIAEMLERSGAARAEFCGKDAPQAADYLAAGQLLMKSDPVFMERLAAQRSKLLISGLRRVQKTIKKEKLQRSTAAVEQKTARAPSNENGCQQAARYIREIMRLPAEEAADMVRVYLLEQRA